MEGAGLPVAHGVDLVEIKKFARLFEGSAEVHLSRYFTASELSSVGSDARRSERLAGRYAIKEAVLKALGTGWGDSISFKDVEVVASKLGAPSVVLHRRLTLLAVDRGISRWLVSSAHAGEFVIGSAIGVSAV